MRMTMTMMMTTAVTVGALGEVVLTLTPVMAVDFLMTVGTILAKGSNVGAGGVCIRRGSMVRYIVLPLALPPVTAGLAVRLPAAVGHKAALAPGLIAALMANPNPVIRRVVR